MFWLKSWHPCRNQQIQIFGPTYGVGLFSLQLRLIHISLDIELCMLHLTDFGSQFARISIRCFSGYCWMIGSLPENYLKRGIWFYLPMHVPAAISQYRNHCIIFSFTAVLLSFVGPPLDLLWVRMMLLLPWRIFSRISFVVLLQTTTGWRSAPAYSQWGSTRGSTWRLGWSDTKTSTQELTI